MTRCLNEQTLLDLHEGDGASGDRAHVTGCPACAARYARLELDLAAITRALRAGPVPARLRPSQGTTRVRWAPAIAALAAVLLLVVAGARLFVPEGREPVPAEETSALERDASAALFAREQSDVATPSEASTGLAHLAAALDGEPPCDWAERLSDPACQYVLGGS